MIRFVVYPGWITSYGDMDRHYITAPQLMRLYEVDAHECIIIEEDKTPSSPSRDFIGYTDDYLARLLPLAPRVKDYSPVTPQERLRYPLPEGQTHT